MIGREEICNVFGYLIQTINIIADPNLKIKIMDNTVVIGNVIKHAEEFHQKLRQEQEKIGGGNQVILTQDAYVALVKKIEEADRIISASKATATSVEQED